MTAKWKSPLKRSYIAEVLEQFNKAMERAERAFLKYRLYRKKLKPNIVKSKTTQEEVPANKQ